MVFLTRYGATMGALIVSPDASATASLCGSVATYEVRWLQGITLGENFRWLVRGWSKAEARFPGRVFGYFLYLLDTRGHSFH